MQVQSYWRYPFGVGHDVAAFSSCKCYRDDSWGAKKKVLTSSILAEYGGCALHL